MHLQMSVESNIISKASINVFVLCWSTDMETQVGMNMTPQISMRIVKIKSENRKRRQHLTV